MESRRGGLEEGGIDEELKDLASPGPAGKLIRAQGGHYLTSCCIVTGVGDASKEARDEIKGSCTLKT